MAKIVNQPREKQALQAVKDYVDRQATAQVVRTETTLYTNTTGQTGNITITLSQPFTNFDAIIVYVGTGNGLKGRTTNVEISSADLLDGRNINFYPAYDAVAYATVNVGRYNTTDNMLWANIVKSNGWTSQNIAVGVSKVVGLNYTPLQNYSTAEQVIGTWIDGRPVYQKTVTINITASAATSSEREIGSLNVADLNIDKIIYSEAVLVNTSNSNFNQMPVATIASGVSTFTRLYYLGSEQKLQVLSTGISYAVQQVIATLKYVKAP